MPRECSIPECTRPLKARELCNAHYLQWSRFGDPMRPVKHRARGEAKHCSVEGCERPYSGRGYCGTHLRRLRNHGMTDRPRWIKADSQIKYVTAHSRLRSERGPASQHACVSCGSPAVDWAYKGDAPDEMMSEQGRPYSADLTYYQPMCKDCHRKMDWVDKKTHCKWGHEFTAENTAFDGHRRRCRACDRRKSAARKASGREVA